MKLITHNMLTSNIIKGVTKGFPLNITASKVETMEVDFNPAFVVKSMNKVDWPALRQAATQVGKGDDLPEELDTGLESNEELLKKIHHVLLEIEVIEGNLECPETGRQFPISNGCPNMLLKEDEVGN